MIVVSFKISSEKLLVCRCDLVWCSITYLLLYRWDEYSFSVLKHFQYSVLTSWINILFDVSVYSRWWIPIIGRHNCLKIVFHCKIIKKYLRLRNPILLHYSNQLFIDFVFVGYLSFRRTAVDGRPAAAHIWRYSHTCNACYESGSRTHDPGVRSSGDQVHTAYSNRLLKLMLRQ